MRSSGTPFSLSRAAQACGTSPLIGIGVTAAMAAAKFQTIDRDGFEDRVYRLYYNQVQT